MTRMAFELWGTEPAPQGSKNPWGGEANKNTKPWREALAAEAAEAMREEGWDTIPSGHPVELVVYFVFGRPKSHYRANGDLKPTAPTFKASKPDTDKLLRALCDALSKVVFHDDAQVAVVVARKIYVNDRFPQPGVSVQVDG